MAKADGRVHRKKSGKGAVKAVPKKSAGSKKIPARAGASKLPAKVRVSSKRLGKTPDKLSPLESASGKRTSKGGSRLTSPVSGSQERSSSRRGGAYKTDIMLPTSASQKTQAPQVAQSSIEGRLTATAMSKKPRAKAEPTVLPEGYRPSDAEPFMNEFHRAYFRKKLLQWKEDIIKQNKETLHVLHEDTLQHADLADRATSETDRALELRARDRQRKLIAKIDAALARIEDGSYGYCEDTGEPISLKRLDARPIATLSLEAQERHERREKVYRDD